MSQFDTNPADNIQLYYINPPLDTWWDLSKPLTTALQYSVGGMIGG